MIGKEALLEKQKNLGLVQFRKYIIGLGKNPQLPPTAVISEITGLSQDKVTQYTSYLRRTEELPRSTQEEKLKRMSVAMTRAKGDKWVKILPYAQLRMSPRETRFAMIADGIIAEDDKVYNSNNMRNFFAIARKNGLVRFSKAEAYHVDATTIRVSDYEMQKRAYLWLNAEEVSRINNVSYSPRDRLEWFELLGYLNENRMLVKESVRERMVRNRLSAIFPLTRKRFQDFVLGWKPLNYGARFKELASAIGQTPELPCINLMERVLLCDFMDAKTEQFLGDSGKFRDFVSNIDNLPKHLDPYFSMISSTLQARFKGH